MEGHMLSPDEEREIRDLERTINARVAERVPVRVSPGKLWRCSAPEFCDQVHLCMLNERCLRDGQ
jgi:hypothetical protein